MVWGLFGFILYFHILFHTNVSYIFLLGLSERVENDVNIEIDITKLTHIHTYFNA